MKKFNLFLTAITSIFLYSCNSNTDDALNNEEFESAINQETVTLNSEKDFFSMFPEVQESEIIIPDKDVVKPKSFQNITAYGYTKLSSAGVQKVAFNKTNASVFGLSSGIYLAEFYTVIKEIDIPANSYVIPMPNGCNGWRPNFTSSTDYGYSLEYGNNGKVYLTTRITCVKYNMSGKYLNIWKPTSLSSLYWNYGLGYY